MYCIYTTLCPLVFRCCHSLSCFPGNGHYLLLLSQCDNHGAKAAPLQRPQEMEIQCCVCVCVYSANFPFRWALIYVQESRGRVSAPYSTDAASEGDGEGGGTSGAIHGSAGIPPPPSTPRQGTPSLFASRSAHTTGKLMGWWMRWDREEEGILHRRRVIVVIASEWRIRFSPNPFLILDTYTCMNVCSHKHICLHAKVFIHSITWSQGV